MSSSLRPLFFGATISGRAKTVTIPPGENAAIHHAVQTAKRGDILVVDAAGDLNHGSFGDILAQGCINRGIKGLVIDGTVRDTAELRLMQFPVYCRGANPSGTGKSDCGAIDVEIQCGGVRVRPNDIIVADDDGVVVVPFEVAQDVIDQVAEIARWEDTVKERLAAGETTVDILGIAFDA